MCVASLDRGGTLHYSSGAQGGRSWHGLDWAWDLPYLTPKPMFSALQDELHQGRGSYVPRTPCWVLFLQ